MNTDRTEFKDALVWASWNDTDPCPTCEDGSIPADPPRLRIHSFLGGFGCDTDVSDVLKKIDDADDVRWVDDLFGHELAVLIGGKVYRYDAQRPKEGDDE